MLMHFLVRTSATVLAALALTVGGVAAAGARPAPRPAALPVIAFDLPVRNGLEIPPDVAGGTLSPVRVVGKPAMRTLQYPPPPGGVEFAVANPAPHKYQYESRFLSIAWRNVATGRSGVLRLRHWQKTQTSDGYASTLPTSAVAETGSGAVVATVRVMRDNLERPPQVIDAIPGLNALTVP
ncbi:hypothetical protein [Gordonia paraffinivorans]|uniref:hypothetical protein n=1 Tax=Gordonia paraffinivorans TaxID=175628 RepID=UPI00242AA661|nr:hypothetical protein [Gordonia paraffinivorans]